jgi:hypothetical protein
MYSVPTTLPVSVLGASIISGPIAYTGNTTFAYVAAGVAFVFIGALLKRTGRFNRRTFVELTV